jgi:hypothetical protein
MFVNVHARPNVAKESAVMSISGDADIIDPPIFAIVLPQPVLHSKIFTGVKVTGVNLYTAVKIVSMDTV